MSRRPVPRPRPEVRRALDVETSLPIPKPTLTERLKLKAMNKLFSLSLPWITRRIGAAVAAAATVIGVSESDAKGTAGFVAGAVVFGYDLLQKVIRNWWAKRKLKQQAPTP